MRRYCFGGSQERTPARLALGILTWAAVAMMSCEDVSINWAPEPRPALRPAGEELRRVQTQPASAPSSGQHGVRREGRAGSREAVAVVKVIASRSAGREGMQA